jgi:hypothetical protein
MVMRRVAGTRRVVGIVLVTLLALSPWVIQEAAAQAPPCQFVLGFAELRGMLGPEIVGECLENQRTITTPGHREPLTPGRVHLLSPGDAVQRTTKGVLIWFPTLSAVHFFDELGIFDLQHGRTRRQLWTEIPVTAGQRSDQDLALQRCLEQYYGAIIPSIYGDPAEERRIEGEAAAARYLCERAAEEHGQRGVDCFHDAWRSSRGVEQVFPGSGRQVYDDAFRACLGGR